MMSSIQTQMAVLVIMVMMFMIAVRPALMVMDTLCASQKIRIFFQDSGKIESSPHFV